MPTSQPIYDAQGEQALMTDLWDPRLADDPRAFVRYVYPWGQVGTPLAEISGPRNWQDKLLLDIANYIRDARIHKQIYEVLPDMFRASVRSGRGIGKSALYGMIAHWLVSTRLGSSVWVAANGEPQLKTKTFPEVAKWVSMANNAHWFDINVLSIQPAKWFSELVRLELKIDPKYWYIQAQLWSEENPDAFAGAHNCYGEMYLFDEASGIPRPIWTVAQGVFTEAIVDRYWLGFSNPRRNDGAFFECFNKNRDLWKQYTIDARTVEGLAQDGYEAIIKEHGPDSDEARVEVYGEFPNQAVDQFISHTLAFEATQREVYLDSGAPLLMAIDVARGDRDYNVFAFRRGRDARSVPWQRFHSTDLVATANKAAEAAIRHRVDAIFVDGNGVGAGVVDLLKNWKFRVIEVQAGAAADDDNRYLNRRAEMWARMKDWLGTGAILGDPILVSDLVSVEYKYHDVNNKLILESKDHMREKRGLASPDMADTLAMTFNQPIARNDARFGTSRMVRRKALSTDYPMFG